MAKVLTPRQARLAEEAALSDFTLSALSQQREARLARQAQTDALLTDLARQAVRLDVSLTGAPVEKQSRTEKARHPLLDDTALSVLPAERPTGEGWPVRQGAGFAWQKQQTDAEPVFWKPEVVVPVVKVSGALSLTKYVFFSDNNIEPGLVYRWNFPDFTYYVGSTYERTFRHRTATHRSTAIHHRHNNVRFSSALRRWPSVEPEIVEVYASRAQAERAEHSLIWENRMDALMLNVAGRVQNRQVVR